MYYKEHAPPHFHAKYGDQRASFSIQDLRLLDGKLPNRVVSLVLEWAFQHRDELMENWGRIERNEALRAIEPLVWEIPYALRNGCFICRQLQAQIAV